MTKTLEKSEGKSVESHLPILETRGIHGPSEIVCKIVQACVHFLGGKGLTSYALKYVNLAALDIGHHAGLCE